MKKFEEMVIVVWRISKACMRAWKVTLPKSPSSQRGASTESLQAT